MTAGSRGGGIGAALTFALALGVYGLTAAPGVVWGDSASLALQVYDGQLYFGTAGDHPLFVLLGLALARLPGEVARHLNLLSGVCGAAAVAVVFLATLRLTGSGLAGAAAGAALGFSHAFWLHAVIAEVYTLNALCAALTIALALEWYRRGERPFLLGSLAALAVGLTNHLVIASLLPALLFLYLARRPSSWRRMLAGAAVMVVVAGIAYLALPRLHHAVERLWWGPPPIWHYFGFRTDAAAFVRECGYYVLYLLYQFPVVGTVLGSLGIRHLWRTERRVAGFLLLAQGTNALVFLKTTEWTSPGSSKYTFYIQDYVVFAVFVGAGAAFVAKHLPRVRHWLPPAVVVLALATYSLVPRVGPRLGLELLHARSIPHRDNNKFFLSPGKRGEQGASLYAQEAFRVAKPGATVIADYTLFTALRYAQRVQGRRPDIELLMAEDFQRQRDLAPIVAGRIRRHAVYLAGRDPRYYDVGSLEGKYVLVPAAPLLEVIEPVRDSVGN